jgi:Tfp pilus assembly protein PilF
MLQNKTYEERPFMHIHWFCIILLSLCSSCSKHKDKKTLARTHFKMALLDLSEQSPLSKTHAKALANINKAIDLDEKAEYCALKATILLEENQLKESDVWFKRALDIETDETIRSEIMNNYACFLAQTGKQDEAKRTWERLLSGTSYQTPEVAFVNLGKMYMSEHKWDEAQRMFTKAANESPSYTDAHFYRGLTLYHLSRQKQDDKKLAAEAGEEIKVVLALEPTHSGANQLAQKLGIEIDFRHDDPWKEDFFEE